MSAAVAAPVEEFRPQKKEVEVLKVLAEKVTGHVKWYSVAKCYGFICRNDDGGDLFVHRSVISSCARRFPSLRNGEEVEFSVVETSQGIEATCVTGPGGQPVKGTWPIYRRYRATSDPSHKTSDSQAPTTETPVRNSRGPRRRGGRHRSAGGDETKTDENNPELPAKADEPNGVHEPEDGLAHSPNQAVPRQRRRPHPRNPRNRSAPTNGEVVEVNGKDVEPANDQNGNRVPPPAGRRFRRPFQPRGGSTRYMNNWYANSAGGGQYFPPRAYPVGDRNGYDQGARRRNFRAGYARTPRTRPVRSAPGRSSETEEPVAVEEQSTAQVEDLANQVNEVQLNDSTKLSDGRADASPELKA